MSEATKDGWRAHADLPMAAFRDKLRTFIQEHFPEEWKEGFHHPMGRLRGPEGRQWVRTLFKHGWRGPHWPREWGGLDLSIEKQIAYIEEMDAQGVTRILDFGGIQFAPILMECGTEEQKQKFLPAVLSGDHIWAQGFSEPNSGSDLASLQAKAERVGDKLIVNGSKIWNTQAADADWIFMLVRTGRYEKQQQGITFLLVDMKTPGITPTPIRNIVGEAEFYQTFFDNVEVPIENVVGEIDHGWSVAKSVLGIERLAYGNPVPAKRALDMAREIACKLGSYALAETRAKFTQLEMDVHDAFSLYDDVCSELIAGGNADRDLSLLKVYCTELHQKASDLVVELAEDYAAIEGVADINGLSTNIGRLYAWVRAPTIFGGTSEIQRNILSRSLLRPGA